MALTRITTSVVESDAVTTDKIADGAVTTDKIAAGAVTIDKLAASANVSLVHADLTSNVNLVQDNVVRVAANLLSNTYTYANTEIGLLGNNAPETQTLSLGDPANVIVGTTKHSSGISFVRINSAAGQGKYNLDVSGNARIQEAFINTVAISNANPSSTGFYLGSPANIILRASTTQPITGRLHMGVPDSISGLSRYAVDVRSNANIGDTSVTALGVNNVSPAAGTISVGVPANVIIRYHEASGAGNVIIGDATAISEYNLDVRGSANTSTIIVDSLTASRALISGASKGVESSSVTSTELGYVSGVTSAIQNQLDSKTDQTNTNTVQDNVAAAEANIASVISGSTAFTGAVTMNDDLTVQGNLTVAGSFANLAVQDSYTDDRMIMLANSFTGSPSLDVGLLFNRGNQGNAAFFYDESGRRFRLSDTQDPSSNTALSSVTDSNLQLGNLFVESITLDGTAISATGVELNYTDGVISAIQTQLDGKDTKANVDAFASYANTNLDTKANVSATYFLALANDFVTYTRLNANINVVQDNVASITSRSDAFGTYANTNLDTKANVSATYFLALSNDFVTYTRLNANINTTTDNVTAVETRLNANIDIVQDNVDILAGTTLTPSSNTVTSVAGANAYGIGAAITAIARTRVYVSGVSQLPTTDYVVPSSGVMQLTDPSADIPADLPILIQYWD